MGVVNKAQWGGCGQYGTVKAIGTLTLKWSIVTKSGKNGRMSSIFNKLHSSRNRIALDMRYHNNYN